MRKRLTWKLVGRFPLPIKGNLEQLPHLLQPSSKQLELFIRCQARVKKSRWSRNSHLLQKNSKKKSSQCSKNKQLRPQCPLSNRLKKLCLLGRKRQWRPQCSKLLRMKTETERGIESRRLPSPPPQLTGRKGTE